MFQMRKETLKNYVYVVLYVQLYEQKELIKLLDRNIVTKDLLLLSRFLKVAIIACQLPPSQF